LRTLSARSNSVLLLPKHYKMVARVTRNEMAARYAGSLLGLRWVVLFPLLLLAVYAVVYLFVFKVQVAGLSSGQYVLYIFAGLVPYLATAEAMSTGVGSIVTNKAVLNSTVFPIDLVPAKAVLASQATMLAGLAVILVGGLLAGTLSWTIVALPILLVLHAMGVLGVVWVLAILHVLARDVANLVNLLLVVLLVGSPIAYTPDMVPGVLKAFVLLNPLAHVLTAYQGLLVMGELPSPARAFALILLCVGSFVGGGWVFARAKRVVVDYV
jgi:lipopolysaccharide transport system permease protein